MKLITLKRGPLVVAATVIGFFCILQVFRFEFFNRLERMTYDWRVRESLLFPHEVATNLGFVEITDRTIERINNGLLKTPYGLHWPRHVYGRVARELKTQGAKATAFDVLMGERRRDQGQLLFQGRPEPVDSDVAFAEWVGQAGNVLLAAMEDIVPPPLFRTNALALGDITAESDVDGVLRRAHAFRVYRKWNSAFQQVADDPDFGVDLRRATIEPDQIILRRMEGYDPIKVPLDKEGRFDMKGFSAKIPAGVERYQKPFTEERVWHMGIVLAAQELKLDLEKAEVELEKGRITLRGPGGVERMIPVDKDGYFYINWQFTDNDRRLTLDYFDHVIEMDNLHATGATNGLDDEWKWKGKLAIVGSGTTGNDLTDRGATPLQKHALLVSKHWNVANSVITGHFIRPASLPVELGMIGLMGLVATLVTGIISTILVGWRQMFVGGVLVALALVVYAALCVGVFTGFGYWLPMVLPIMGGLAVTYACQLAHLVVFEQKDKWRVKSLLSPHVSPEVMQLLLENEHSIDGARRTVTVLFADIRGFTEMTDRLRDKAAAYIKEHNLTGAAAEAVHDEAACVALDTVNLYLKTVADVVLQHNGMIDKFIGDCVMAFWGAPLPNAHHALHCVRASIDAQQAIYRLNREREAENERRAEENLRRASTSEPLLEKLPVLTMGSGINTGVVTAGVMGTKERRNYTVFGREVNLASRLETVSGRGRIIISEATLAEILQDDSSLALSCVELPPEKVKGIEEKVHIYEVPWRTGEYAPKGDTVAPREGDTMPPFRPGGHDTAYVRPKLAD